MAERIRKHVLAVISGTGERTKLTALSPSGEEKDWKISLKDDTRGTDGALREFCDFCGVYPVATYEAEVLAQLLSHTRVIPHTRHILGQLADLNEWSLILLPTLSNHTPVAIAGLENAKPRKAPLAPITGAYDRLSEAIEKLPADLLQVLSPLLSDDSCFASFAWPLTMRDTYALMKIASFLPGKAPTRRRNGETGELLGDVRDVAMAILSPDGLVAKSLPAYEHRVGQVQMASEVAEALRDGKFLLAEAGTGVGKSLAYLVPAIIWALREAEPVVISTNTKNLQEQLLLKDIPLLHKALPMEFEAVLLKGRGNYPCIRTLISAATDAANSLFRNERLAAAFFLSWLAHHDSSDLEDLSTSVKEALPELPPLIARIRSQGVACAGKGCSFKDCCPVEVARSWARRADVLVVNHALTFAEARTQVLPKYSRLILDEAQNVESVATDALSLECSGYGISQFERILTGGPNSVVEVIRRRLFDQRKQLGVEICLDALELVQPAMDDFLRLSATFGGCVIDFCFAAQSRQFGEPDRATVRLTAEARESEGWKEIGALGAQMLAAGINVFNVLYGLYNALNEMDKTLVPGSEGIEADVYSVKTRVEELCNALAEVLKAEGDEHRFVTWAESWRSRRGASWSLRAAPIDVGPVLDEAIYQHKEAIIFTSATMTVDGEFNYFRNRIGLDQYYEKLVEATLPSPFELTEQLLLCIPSDMPDPSERGFDTAIIQALWPICELTKGGTLILFTARSRMLQAFDALKSELKRMGLTPLCQDMTGNRGEVLEALKNNPKAVLFGLKSFWEGVDVPGDALRCVVITKLPFAVPSDPIVESRQEDARRKGLNPMEDYYIPEAIVGFKQGFGRLIRTQSDHGVVFVLDRRVLTKNYGRRFFKSISRCGLVRESMAECLEAADNWLSKESAPEKPDIPE